MKIITIARQFGSGGRELGKRLSGELGYDYYDREIITAIAEEHALSEEYVSRALENHGWTSVPLSFQHSFAVPMIMSEPQVKLLSTQRRLLEKIAEYGRDCIIVGRNADVILEEYRPYRIFVCASEEARVRRCRMRGDDGNVLSERQIVQNMKKIDKNRAKTRSFVCDKPWGEPTTYDLVVNTTDRDIKTLARTLAVFLNAEE